MIVSQQAIDAALIRIFRDFQIKADGRLSLMFLQQQWSLLNLRSGDLIHAIRRLESEDCMQLRLSGGQLHATLLARGERRIRELPSGVEMLRRGLQAVELYVVDHRHPPSSPADHLRRATDAPGSRP